MHKVLQNMYKIPILKHLKQLILIYIIIFLEAVKKHPLSKSGRRNEIEKCVAKWLRGSRDHDDRRMKRAKLQIVDILLS